ncbi:thioesterase II family protein [Alkalihalobacterium bogoriense]|uniref:thioesterase II family protein n=1 Tax=Alkalihalobacterium bogoriense TaxID=246272 RepID=UPI00047AB83E|nr:thioesterase domain-containing protein [Alkalihalobacterium bogoriense]
MEKTKLFCFPFAGGSSLAYNPWRKEVIPSIDLIPVELSGRGVRNQEQLYPSLQTAVDDLFAQISPQIVHSEYALFGHSMGSWIVYELVKKIQNENIKLPEHVFFSGKEAPHVKKERFYTDGLDDKQLIEHIRPYGGIPDAFLDSEEFMSGYLRILRADLQLIEQYEPTTVEKVMCPISVLNGIDDDLDLADLLAWESLTTESCRIYHFNGGHFFIREQMKQVIDTINDTLKKRTPHVLM